MIRLTLFSLLLLTATATTAELSRVWQTTQGKIIQGSLVKVEGENVTILRKNSTERITVTKEDLMPPDIIYLNELEKKNKPAGDSQEKPEKSPSSGTTTGMPQGSSDDDEGDEVAGDPAKGRLYPRTKDEIRTSLHAILKAKTKGTDKASEEVQEAIRRLNAYRFLSGVYSEVGTESQMNENAAEAAGACAKEGTLSHSLGHYTERCNLSVGQRDMASTVDGYIGDGGDNNRERRGHRRWCLNPPMANAGFGREGKFGAMWCMDGSGRKTRDPWSYPGRGLYPLEYVRGNAWSFYMPTALPSDTKVRMWKLTARPAQPIPWGEEPKGREISVDYSFVFDNTINFEPDPKIRGKRGIYWVRVHGRGLTEQYLTELY
ncbi:MAG TPA: hypothetical protein VG796_25700 [Verrucomicrobiales bacterium]|nr:hypothetical protein [Verrucomicrobiales bacterium]